MHADTMTATVPQSGRPQLHPAWKEEQKEMTTFPNTITVDGKRYRLDHKLSGGLPQVWVHERRSEPAVLYLTGSSLTDGTDRENAAYLRRLIREKLHA